MDQNQDIITAEDGQVLVPEPVQLPDVVQRYLDGETIREIAREDRKSPRLIYKLMMSKVGDHFKDLVTEALINRIADADVELENAMDKVTVARARELAKLARMDFERRRPDLYGAQTGAGGIAVQVNINR